MSTLKICRICLRTEAKGYKFERYQLKYFYEEVTALKVANSDELPQWFCYECATMLYKFHKFKEKCYTGQKCLKELLWKGPITYEAVYKSDQATKLQSTLKTITITDKVKTFTIKDVELESNNESENTTQKNLKSNEHLDIENLESNSSQIKFKTGNIYDFDTEEVNSLNSKIISDLETRDINKPHTDNDSNSETKYDTKLVTNNLKNKSKSSNTSYSFENTINVQTDCSKNISEDQSSPISILVQEDKVLNIKSEQLTTKKSKNIELSNLKEFGKYLSEDNWKKVILTEEEAVKEFRERAEDSKYCDAAYKCSDCFKGFSKKDMLNRHVQSRHSEDLGDYECRFCRMRFKWKCHLRKHIQQHYTKYECLRCHVVFHLDTSALLHEEYHSGTTKKCRYCNEEFRHVTTYYTHMRTHRSAHVCVRCGASFVSRAGLRQHSRRKHPEDQLDSPSSSSEAGPGAERPGRYCARCDLRFHSRRALTEHLFHSDMHTELIKQEHDDADVSPSKKIMGKRLREKITKELLKRKSDLDISTPVKAKRKKRIKRKHRKPTTCYQCGLEFPTQAACMKHHTAEHPRTSFHSGRERHICELCGASLAPGSVAVHQNMHSRARVRPCGTCGRQFHSAVGLKRHLVTHTGEKPFACPLCEKRFTQSNSMKLHYRTFHLKQPYPKRIRKKKKDQPNQSTEQDDSYEEELDSVPETAPVVPPVPDVTAPEVPAVLQVVGENGSLEEENMHYLTLT